MGAVLEGQSVMCRELGQQDNVGSNGETELEVPGIRAVN